jgi:hypothetical protein
MKCDDCEHLDKELGCKLNPSEIENNTCLLRHIAITLNYLCQELIDDSDEDNWWKKS